MRRPAAATLWFSALLLAGSLLAACGNTRTQPSPLSQPALPVRLHVVALPDGVSFLAPRGWPLTPQRPPLLATIISGQAVVAIWRYDHPGAPVQTLTQLEAARTALIAAARRRDPSLQLIRAGIRVLNAHATVELDAFEHIDGLLRRVRSLHLFAGRTEVVVDAYAPPAVFHAVDHAVFSPLVRSLQLGPATR